VPNLLTMMALIHRNRANLPNGKALLYEDIAQAYLKTIDEFRRITEHTESLQDIKRWLGEVDSRCSSGGGRTKPQIAS
jgi:predicted NACHT family NTPase